MGDASRMVGCEELASCCEAATARLLVPAGACDPLAMIFCSLPESAVLCQSAAEQGPQGGRGRGGMVDQQQSWHQMSLGFCVALTGM